MSQFTKTIIRCAVDVTSREPFRDFFTGRNPEFWNSTDVEFQLAFFKGSAGTAELLDVSDFESVSLAVMDITRSGAPFMSRTVAAAALNTGLTLAQWQDGSGQHVVISFAFDETALPIDAGALNADFWCVVYGITNTVPSSHDTFGATVLRVVEDGVPLGDGPIQGGNLIPGNAVYDGSGHYVLAVTQDKVYRWTDGGSHDTDLVNGTETVSVSNSTFVTQGATVTLRGTIGATVTAVVRGGIFLTADESDARYVLKTGDARITSIDDGNTYKIDVRIVDGMATLQLTLVGGGGGVVSIVCVDNGLTYLLGVVIVDGVATLKATAA